MIEIIIKVDGEKVLDSIKKKESTLLENSLILRRLEEIKFKLLSINYESELEISEDVKKEFKDYIDKEPWKDM